MCPVLNWRCSVELILAIGCCVMRQSLFNREELILLNGFEAIVPYAVSLKEQHIAFRGKLFTNNVRTCAEAEILALIIIVHVLRVVGLHFSLSFLPSHFDWRWRNPWITLRAL